MNTRIELEVRDDGLYYADGSRRFRRIANANGKAGVSYYQGRLTVYAPATDTPIITPAEDRSRTPIRGDASPADAMAELQRHLLNRADVIDMADGQDAVDQRTRSARAYKDPGSRPRLGVCRQARGDAGLDPGLDDDGRFPGGPR